VGIVRGDRALRGWHHADFDAIWAFRYHGALPQNFEAAIFRAQPQDLRLDLSRRCCRWVGIVAAAIGAISAIMAAETPRGSLRKIW
jgi:hypothetical protein